MAKLKMTDDDASDDRFKKCLLFCTPFLYSNNEDMVLWIRSEKIDCIVSICRGMMEYWNAGILGSEENDLLLYR